MLPFKTRSVALLVSAACCMIPRNALLLLLTLNKSKLVDQVHAEKELIARLPIVVCLFIPGVIKAEFWAKHNRGPDVLGDVERIFSVLRSESSTLALLVV
jgi:hypothetical protein